MTKTRHHLSPSSSWIASADPTDTESQCPPEYIFCSTDTIVGETEESDRPVRVSSPAGYGSNYAADPLPAQPLGDQANVISRPPATSTGLSDDERRFLRLRVRHHKLKYNSIPSFAGFKSASQQSEDQVTIFQSAWSRTQLKESVASSNLEVQQSLTRMSLKR